MDDKRQDRRIKNRVDVYYKRLDNGQVDEAKDEIYTTVEPDDSFSFFMSLKKLDSSFGDLNKAFVLMMKQMDSKLNYLIKLLRDNGRIDEFEGFEKSYSCDLSSKGLSFVAEGLKEGDAVYLKIFLPIAMHHCIKAVGRVVRETSIDSKSCYGIEFEDISYENKELIIHYMIFVERKIAKNKLEHDG